MKAFRAIGGLALSGMIVWGVGCSKSEEPTAPPVRETPPPPPAPGPAAQTAPAPAAAASTEAQGLIDKAKALIDQKKYTEALDVLKQLGDLKLTPEQQKMVDDLKALVQKNMAEQGASEAGKAVGDALGGQK